ncbi:MAG: TlyA family RNA methyltransferase [Tissierellia bacterium]|nr:TlyA family RNA methyltransferase [Tissierellia bacterium]
MKKRADVLLFERGLVDSREKAKRVIMEGVVFIGAKRIDKPGDRIDIDSAIRIKENPIKFVSRGGLKLEKAIKDFNIDLDGSIAMDIGASTGGFTDCMLQKGAQKVYAVDVGYGQLDWKLRQDPRVIVKERTNIRYVTREDIPELLDFIAIDVSFISLTLVLPVAKELLSDGQDMVALIKPQFEAGREKVGKKGVVRDQTVHFEVIKSISDYCNTIGLRMIGLGFSPIVGAMGNIEFLAHITNNKQGKSIEDESISQVVREAHDVLQ